MDDEKLRRAMKHTAKRRPVSEPEPPERWRGWRASKAPPATLAILGNDGRVHVPKDAGKVVESPNGGLHVVEASARFWLPRKIPAGWLTVYVEDDPEPVTTRKPAGYGKKTIEMLVGPYVLHLVGGGLREKKPGFGNLNVPLVVGVLVFVVAIAVGILLFRGRFG